mgnify:CR=1 FL=1
MEFKILLDYLTWGESLRSRVSNLTIIIVKFETLEPGIYFLKNSFKLSHIVKNKMQK